MANDVAKIAGVSYTNANEMIATCERLGLLRQISKGRRNRKFIYQEYVTIVSEGTELQKEEEFFFERRGDFSSGELMGIISQISSPEFHPDNKVTLLLL